MDLTYLESEGYGQHDNNPSSRKSMAPSNEHDQIIYHDFDNSSTVQPSDSMSNLAMLPRINDRERSASAFRDLLIESIETQSQISESADTKSPRRPKAGSTAPSDSSGSTVPSQTKGKKRSRQDRDNSSESVSSKGSGKKTLKRKPTRKGGMWGDILDKKVRLEMPTRNDFMRIGAFGRGLNKINYKWAKPSDIARGPAIDVSETARPPFNPDGVGDDSDEETLSLLGYPPSPRRRKLSSKYVSPQDDKDLDEAVPACLATLPVEVREKIFENLLISKHPVYVFDGWTKLCRHSRKHPCPALPTGILGTCRQFFSEGIRVLYGRNRFIYRIRDTSANGPHGGNSDVGAEASNNEDMQNFDGTVTEGEVTLDNDEQHQGEDVDEDGSADGDYEDDALGDDADDEEYMHEVKDGSSFSCRDIYASKYKCLFRDIVVEAEHNHQDAQSMKTMAEAIAAFNRPSEQLIEDTVPVYPQGTDPSLFQCNIRTLTIRVHPRPLPAPEDGKFFTFENFLAPGCPILTAVRKLPPQFLRVEIIPRHLRVNGGSPARMILDMRQWRLKMGVGSSGVGRLCQVDSLMQFGRDKQAEQCEKALGKLQEGVRTWCQKYLASSGPVGQNDEADDDEEYYEVDNGDGSDGADDDQEYEDEV